VPGPQELLLIALVALFVLGPERLPEAARAAAKGLRRLRTYSVRATQDLRGIADLGDIEREVQELRRELGRTKAELRRAVRDTIRPVEEVAGDLRALAAPVPPPSVDAPAAPPAGRTRPLAAGSPDGTASPRDDADGADGADDADADDASGPATV